MAEQTQKRMWANLVKGVACLVVGAAVIATIEVLWDCASESDWRHAAGGFRESKGGTPPPGDFERQRMMSFVLDDDQEDIGSQELPALFVEECFDARELGDARCSVDGGVIGIVSSMPATDLFNACAGKLADSGWLQMESGYPLRCTFLKEGGSLHWLFLDVNQVSESGVAVMVVEDGDRA